MKTKLDLTGKSFQNWTVLYESDPMRYARYWICKCKCGTFRRVSQTSLISGKSTSCGCNCKRRLTHGKSKSPEYKIWCGLHTRCYNHNHISYADYGARGITICDRWKSFENFLFDMGLRPSTSHSIDRINNNGSYCPENCQWSTPVKQASNRRGTVLYNYNGNSHTLSEWARITNIPLGCLSARIYRKKWPIEKVLSIPSRKKH